MITKAIIILWTLFCLAVTFYFSPPNSVTPGFLFLAFLMWAMVATPLAVVGMFFKRGRA
jgi:hypothetical protein